jgi:hypothetical protein
LSVIRVEVSGESVTFRVLAENPLRHWNRSTASKRRSDRPTPRQTSSMMSGEKRDPGVSTISRRKSGQRSRGCSRTSKGGCRPRRTTFGCFIRSIETSIARQVVTFEEYGDPAHPVVKAAEARIEALAEKKAQLEGQPKHAIRARLETRDDRLAARNTELEVQGGRGATDMSRSQIRRVTIVARVPASLLRTSDPKSGCLQPQSRVLQPPQRPSSHPRQRKTHRSGAFL